MINSTNLQRVVAVDRFGSFTVAAEALNISQSAVTKSVANLEKELGYAIFDRSARDMVATDRGRIFLNRARRIVLDLGKLSAEASAYRNTAQHSIRLGVSPASLQGLLNQALRKLLVQNRDIYIQLYASTLEQSIGGLRCGDLDVLVAPKCDVAPFSGLNEIPLGVVGAHFFVRKKHPLASAKATVDDLRSYQIISPDRVGIYAEKLRGAFSETEGGNAYNVHVIEYFPIIADLVAGTNSIGVVSTKYAAAKSFRRRFSILDLDFFDRHQIIIASTKGGEPSRAVRSLVRALRDCGSFEG